jgi:hypothetical protein
MILAKVHHGYTGPMTKVMGVLLFALSIAAQEGKTPWGRVELKDDAVHLYVDEWPADGKVAMPRLNNPIGTVYLLNDPAKAPLGFQPNLVDWTISKPKSGGGGPDIVVVEVKGKPHPAGDPVVVEPSDDGLISLAAHNAVCHGRLLRYEPQPHKNTVGYWTDENDWCEWRFKVTRPGSFKVLLLQGCGKGQGGSSIRIIAGGRTLDYVVEDTGHFQSFVERAAGTLKIEQAGTFALEIRAVKKAKGAIMDVRQVRLLANDE